ncbi:hypothetical protein CLCR_04427 [Cladophialophora carrionii]|uniref:Uncharacterized protein n=1 Tax=Cladophialophora carrionii TaxID=86049 RepID=A0A1C1CIL2_9EURO|nr:hypothetical protein CLCR_04427 [Cladophialophora carrionii]
MFPVSTSPAQCYIPPPPGWESPLRLQHVKHHAREGFMSCGVLSQGYDALGIIPRTSGPVGSRLIDEMQCTRNLELRGLYHDYDRGRGDPWFMWTSAVAYEGMIAASIKRTDLHDTGNLFPGWPPPRRTPSLVVR